ncbi:hypothetical protein IW261DRAFT_476933 [Armillaria novae-zelandiae]|uniref:Uncharacterized protein n=1 Tax=Armillaria novae-zelandiae TaxID=153914 RepID=A0AA39P191_9AGAR|nr:hypothetical protein IW261DRAFT_476933 [Armillaria novae-zelandiae]
MRRVETATCALSMPVLTPMLYPIFSAMRLPFFQFSSDNTADSLINPFSLSGAYRIAGLYLVFRIFNCGRKFFGVDVAILSALNPMLAISYLSVHLRIYRSLPVTPLQPRTAAFKPGKNLLSSIMTLLLNPSWH